MLMFAVLADRSDASTRSSQWLRGNWGQGHQAHRGWAVYGEASGIRQTVEFFARLCGTSGCVSESQDKPSGLALAGDFPVRV